MLHFTSHQKRNKYPDFRIVKSPRMPTLSSARVDILGDFKIPESGEIVHFWWLVVDRAVG